MKRLERIVWLSLAGAAAAIGPSFADDGGQTVAAGPGTSYVDKVVGGVDVPDIRNVVSDNTVIAIGTPPSAANPVVVLTVTHHIKAGLAHADVVERTTTWSSGSFSPGNVIAAAIGFADPLVWLMGGNPIHDAEHIAASERTKNVMRFEAPPVPVAAGAAQDFDSPVVNQSVLIEAVSSDGKVDTGEIVETDRDGNLAIPVKALLAQLQIDPAQFVPPPPPPPPPPPIIDLAAVLAPIPPPPPTAVRSKTKKGARAPVPPPEPPVPDIVIAAPPPPPPTPSLTLLVSLADGTDRPTEIPLPADALGAAAPRTGTESNP